MCERRMSGFESFCVYMCVLALRHSHAHRQLPSFASACRFGLSGCTLSKSVCEPRVCVCVLAVGGGEGGCKDIKNGKKTFFFSLLLPFVCECDGASFSALSHGHKDDSDNPFISLTSCRLREDR